MSAINLFWQLDISDETKYLLVFLIIMCIVAVGVYNKNKNKKSKAKKDNKYFNKNINKTPINKNFFHDDYYNEYLNKRNLNKCHHKYMECVENNARNGTDEFCYPCLNGGNKPDYFYNQETNEWVSRDDN
jgi:hypothetical protein